MSRYILSPNAATRVSISIQVWVPAVYSSPGIYLVKHPIDLGLYGSLAILTLGLLSIWANFDADRQRHAFRQVRVGWWRVSVGLLVCPGRLCVACVCLRDLLRPTHFSL